MLKKTPVLLARGAAGPGVLFCAITIAGCASVPQTRPTASAPVGVDRTKQESQVTISSFDELWNGAGQDSAQPAGLGWEHANNSTLERALKAALTHCGVKDSTEFQAIDKDSYFVLIVGSDGRVRSAASRPDSKLVDCMRSSLATAQFTSPPWDGYRWGIAELAPRSVAGVDRARLPASATFDDGLLRFVADASTKEGQQWLVAHMGEIGPALTPMMQNCPSLAQHIMHGDTRVVFEIAADGSTQRVLWDGARDEIECGNAQLARAKLPPPPFDGYWFSVVSRPH